MFRLWLLCIDFEQTIKYDKSSESAKSKLESYIINNAQPSPNKSRPTLSSWIHV